MDTEEGETFDIPAKFVMSDEESLLLEELLQSTFSLTTEESEKVSVALRSKYKRSPVSKEEFVRVRR
jgi:hypothetical protein